MRHTVIASSAQFAGRSNLGFNKVGAYFAHLPQRVVLGKIARNDTPELE